MNNNISYGHRNYRNRNSRSKSNSDDRKKRNDRYREINEQLIKYIYSTVDISPFKYEILDDKQQLGKIVASKYYLSPNFTGKNCFLVFTKLRSKYYSVVIDRKQLSYTLDKVNFNNLSILHCNVDVDLSIFDGSIFDGVYVRKGSDHKFIITDVYYFKGSDFTKLNLKHKMIELKCYLDSSGSILTATQIKINHRYNLELFLNDVYSPTEITEFMTNKLKTYSDFHVRGICFYPEISGTKLIYNFTSGDRGYSGNTYNRDNDTEGSNGKDNRNTESRYNTDHSNRDSNRRARLTKTVFVAKTDSDIYAILEMKATKTADNYKLYAVDKVKIGGSIKLKKYQMDIAYVPDIETSEWCKDIFNHSNNGTVLVKCIWRDSKRKWQPLELCENVKLPSLMEDIRKSLVEIEESDSDSEDD